MKIKLLLFLLIMTFSLQALAATYSNCRSNQGSDLRRVHTALEEKLADLLDRQSGLPSYDLAYVQKNFVEMERRVPNTRLFSNHNMLYVRFVEGLKSTLNQMVQKNRNGYAYKCTTNSDRGCGKGQAYAYVKMLGSFKFNAIYVCPAFWELPEDERVSTLFHELSHLGADTTDTFGNSLSNEGFVGQTKEAYFLENLVKKDLEDALRIYAWRLLWMKQI